MRRCYYSQLFLLLSTLFLSSIRFHFPFHHPNPYRFWWENMRWNKITFSIFYNQLFLLFDSFFQLNWIVSMSFWYRYTGMSGGDWGRETSSTSPPMNHHHPTHPHHPYFNKRNEKIQHPSRWQVSFRRRVLWPLLSKRTSESLKTDIPKDTSE